MVASRAASATAGPGRRSPRRAPVTPAAPVGVIAVPIDHGSVSAVSVVDCDDEDDGDEGVPPLPKAEYIMPPRGAVLVVLVLALVLLAAGLLERGIVLLPITTCEAEAARDMRVPEIVTTPPGVKVWESMMYWDWLFAEYVLPSMIKADGGMEAAIDAIRGFVTPPTMSWEAEGAREMVVPEKVTTPPGVRV